MAVLQHAFGCREFTGGISQSSEGTFRRLNVGLTDVEVIHMDTAFFCGIGKGDKFTDCRLWQFHTFFGYLWHKDLF